jgi:hypothetical protein
MEALLEMISYFCYNLFNAKFLSLNHNRCHGLKVESWDSAEKSISPRFRCRIAKSFICYCAAPSIDTMLHLKSRDSSVGIALGYGLDDRGSRVRFPAGAGNFFLHHRVQNGSGAPPASYSLGTGGGGSFPGGKVAGAWSWPLTSI